MENSSLRAQSCLLMSGVYITTKRNFRTPTLLIRIITRGRRCRRPNTPTLQITKTATTMVLVRSPSSADIDESTKAKCYQVMAAVYALEFILQIEIFGTPSPSCSGRSKLSLKPTRKPANRFCRTPASRRGTEKGLQCALMNSQPS